MDFFLEHSLETYSYLAIFIFMITNGLATLPSSQFLYLAVGFFVSSGSLALVPALIVGAIGNTIGNVLLYEITRRKGLTYITRFQLFPEREIRKVQILFNQRGYWFAVIGKLLPAIKVFIPIVAGIGQMRRIAFISAMAITSAIWAFIFISIGYYFGRNLELLGWYPALLFIVVIGVLYVFYLKLNSRAVLEQLENEIQTEKNAHKETPLD